MRIQVAKIIPEKEMPLVNAFVEMSQQESKAKTGAFFLKKFFQELEPTSSEKLLLARRRLIEKNWDYTAIIEVMTVDVLKQFDDWMLTQGYVAYGWTGYDRETNEDFFQGNFTRWFLDDKGKNLSLPNFTQYSGCKIQFIDAHDGNFLDHLVSKKLGTSAGKKHDGANDILAGRKIIVYRTKDDSYYLYFAKFSPAYNKYVIAQSLLNSEITAHINEQYFKEDKIFGTQLADGTPEIPHHLVSSLEQTIQENGGKSFLGSWMAVYLSRFINVYGGYIPTDIRGLKVADQAAMNRIYLSNELLTPEFHVHLPELDTENTGMSNHLIMKLHGLSRKNAHKVMALTTPERLLDSTHPGEETVIVGSGTPENIISIPCCRQIATYALKLETDLTNIATAGLSESEMQYLQTVPELPFSTKLINNPNSITLQLKDNVGVNCSYPYNEVFEFNYDLVEHLINIINTLSVQELDAADDNGETLLMYAAKTGQIDLVQALVDKGVNKYKINSQNGSTALTFAVENGHRELILLLWDRTTSLTRITKNNQPIMVSQMTHNFLARMSGTRGHSSNEKEKEKTDQLVATS